MKKYKLNMKNMMIGLGAATAIVAPVATLVACGGEFWKQKFKCW